jgi:nitrogen regulatory protein P-II 1
VQFVNKIKLDVCVNDAQVDAAVSAIATAAGSGKIGDGKIFVYDVEKVVRIRTGEKDAAAV